MKKITPKITKVKAKKTVKKANKSNKTKLFIALGITALVGLIYTELKPDLDIYTDPGNNFEITIPASWNSTELFGKTQNEASQAVEIVHLQSDENEKVGVTIQVTDDVASCESAMKPNSTLAGLPATYIPENYTWKLYTTDVTYSVSYFYPGAGNFPGPAQDMETSSLPQSEMDANNKTVMSIINTLTLPGKQPLNCQ